jgi:hypothetical protein
MPRDGRFEAGMSSSPTYEGFTYNKEEISMDVEEA